MIRLRNNGLNGILADEMGLGKTLQSISMLGYLHEFKRINGPHLVLVPKTTLSNWMNEFRRWLPALTAFKFHGSKEERGYMTSGILVSEPRAWDVVVTTYEVANRAAKESEIPNFKGSYLGRFHSFRLILGRAIISRNGLEAWTLFPERARADYSR